MNKGTPRFTSWTYEGDIAEATKWLPYAVGMLKSCAKRAVARHSEVPKSGVLITVDATTGRVHIVAGLLSGFIYDVSTVGGTPVISPTTGVQQINFIRTIGYNKYQLIEDVYFIKDGVAIPYEAGLCIDHNTWRSKTRVLSWYGAKAYINGKEVSLDRTVFYAFLKSGKLRVISYPNLCVYSTSGQLESLTNVTGLINGQSIAYFKFFQASPDANRFVAVVVANSQISKPVPFTMLTGDTLSVTGSMPYPGGSSTANKWEFVLIGDILADGSLVVTTATEQFASHYFEIKHDVTTSSTVVDGNGTVTGSYTSSTRGVYLTPYIDSVWFNDANILHTATASTTISGSVSSSKTETYTRTRSPTNNKITEETGSISLEASGTCDLAFTVSSGTLEIKQIYTIPDWATSFTSSWRYMPFAFSKMDNSAALSYTLTSEVDGPQGFFTNSNDMMVKTNKNVNSYSATVSSKIKPRGAFGQDHEVSGVSWTDITTNTKKYKQTKGTITPFIADVVTTTSTTAPYEVGNTLGNYIGPFLAYSGNSTSYEYRSISHTRIFEASQYLYYTFGCPMDRYGNTLYWYMSEEDTGIHVSVKINPTEIVFDQAVVDRFSASYKQNDFIGVI